MQTWALRGNGKGPEKETETKQRPLRKTTRARAGGSEKSRGGLG